MGSTSAGTATEASRSDHVHAHGNQAGGSLHADVTGSTDGFMIAADKTKLDGLGVFGNDYQTSASEIRNTTTLAIFQDKVSLVTPALTGTYRIAWGALSDQIDKEGEIRLYNSTDVAAVGLIRHSRNKLASITSCVGGTAEVVFTGTSKTFIVQWRDATGGNVQGISDAMIELWRVA